MMLMRSGGKFLLPIICLVFRDNSDEVWWEVSTVDPETHQPVSGYTSRYNFYPKDSERREDQYPWFLGKINKNQKIR